MWEVSLCGEVEVWFLELCATDTASADLVTDAIDLLAREGPSLGRPMVDRLRGSRYHNMKELRPGSRGRSEIRIIFAFDPAREAILLVAGDKAGDWNSWYESAIPVADTRFDEHLARLKGSKS